MKFLALLLLVGCGNVRVSGDDLRVIATNRTSAEKVRLAIADYDIFLRDSDGNFFKVDWLSQWLNEDVDCWQSMDEVFNGNSHQSKRDRRSSTNPTTRSSEGAPEPEPDYGVEGR